MTTKLRKKDLVNEFLHFETNLESLIPKLQDDEYAKNLYRALCNMRWAKKGVPQPYSCSWRYAGGLVARLRNKGESYMDFYLSGNEGYISSEVSLDLHKLGWKECPWPGVRN